MVEVELQTKHDFTEVGCPHCGDDFYIKTPPDDEVLCPHCGELSEAWADGDIDFDYWYLTKINI